MRALEALLVYVAVMKIVQVEEVAEKQQQLRKMWKDVLLNQFHDVLRKCNTYIHTLWDCVVYCTIIMAKA